MVPEKSDTAPKNTKNSHLNRGRTCRMSDRNYGQVVWYFRTMTVIAICPLGSPRCVPAFVFTVRDLQQVPTELPCSGGALLGDIVSRVRTQLAGPRGMDVLAWARMILVVSHCKMAPYRLDTQSRPSCTRAQREKSENRKARSVSVRDGRRAAMCRTEVRSTPSASTTAQRIDGGLAG